MVWSWLLGIGSAKKVFIEQAGWVLPFFFDIWDTSPNFFFDLSLKFQERVNMQHAINPHRKNRF